MKKYLVLGLCMLALTGCTTKQPTSDVKESNEEVTTSTALIEGMTKYENATDKYSIQYPTGWEIKENYMGTSAIFLSAQESGTDTFRENVNVMIQDLSSSPMTLKEYTELSMGQFPQIITSFNLVDSGSDKLAGKEASYVVYTGVQGTSELKFKQVWTIIDKKAYVLTFTATQTDYDKYVGQFESMRGTIELK